MKKYNVIYTHTTKSIIEAKDLTAACVIAQKLAKKGNKFVQAVIPKN